MTVDAAGAEGLQGPPGGVLTRADRVLLLATVGLIGCLAVLLWGRAPGGGGYAAVESGGRAVGRFDLSEARRLQVGGAAGESRIEIGGGRVRFVDGPCRQRLCVHQGWIERPGAVAVCLPNRVVVQVVGPSPAGAPDAVSQ